MPAEWEPHEATWLVWPTNRVTWPGKMLKQVESIYVEMMRGLLGGERVHLLVPDAKTAARVTALLRAKKIPTANLMPHTVKTVDTWIRDYGPIFVKKMEDGRWKKGAVEFTKWIFNAWGGKYADLALDNRVVDRVPFLRNFRRIDVPVVLEGGSIDMNGRGTCLTTRQCLLNPNRGATRTRRQLEAHLEKNLGVRHVIWLNEGIEGDDTDGHIDDIARFVDARTVLAAVEPDVNDKNHFYLKENLEILRRSSDQDGQKLRLIELPMPGRIEVGKGHSASGRLPASYANFYIGNNAVLVPTYSHRNDKAALKILGRHFPGRRIVGIECTALVYGLGSIHCVTQQQPQ